MKVKSGAFCNTFDLHQATFGLENHFLVILKVVFYSQVFFYCSLYIGNKISSSFKNIIVITYACFLMLLAVLYFGVVSLTTNSAKIK